jgi:hypothetical protein
LSLSKEQVTVVKSTLRSLSSTLFAVSENERMISKGLDEMAKHISERGGELRYMFTGTSLLLTVNEDNRMISKGLDEMAKHKRAWW